MDRKSVLFVFNVKTVVEFTTNRYYIYYTRSPNLKFNYSNYISLIFK